MKAKDGIHLSIQHKYSWRIRYTRETRNSSADVDAAREKAHPRPEPLKAQHEGGHPRALPTIWQLWYFVICAHCLRTDTYTHIHTPTRPFSWTIGKQVADVTLYHWPLLRIRALPHSVGITPKQIQISMISDVNWRGWITLGVEWQEDCSNTRLVRKLLC